MSYLHGRHGRVLISTWLVVILAGASVASPAVAREPSDRRASDPAAAAGVHTYKDGVYRTPPGVSFAPDRLLVKFRGGISAVTQATARQSIEAAVEREFKLVPGLQVLRLRAGRDVIAAVAELSRRPDVEYAMPDFAYRLTVEPDDLDYTSQWALPKIGAPTAWGRSTGSSSVVVAVIDTGIDLDHPDLAANLVPGWNFVADNDDPSDDHGHGTHVAGVIGAVGNNTEGVAGVNWDVSLMPLKICDANGMCQLSQEIAALEFAATHGAHVANASFGAAHGGWEPEEDAIAAAGTAGILFVAAAGNNAANSDATSFYPAGYPLDNIIAVGASTPTDEVASFSNYGVSSVDLVAPGDGIFSTLPDGYGSMSGTSMAAPQVAGAAALVKGLNPSWTPEQVRRQLVRTATPLSHLAGVVASCGRLNVAAATKPSIVLKPVLCLSRRGSGLGTVTSSPATIDCGSTCAAYFTKDTVVTLTATPAAGATFAGWSGPCSGTGSCVVTLSLATTVTATFNDLTSQSGWINSPLAPPGAQDPLPPDAGSGIFETFYNFSLSAGGNVRARTVYTAPEGWCFFASTDTGGVYVERKTSSGWVVDGVLTAPALSPEPLDRWMNCSYFGSLMELSADGSTLLVGQDIAFTPPGLYRCVAFVYRRGANGWKLDGTLYPDGVDVDGTPDLATCGLFGRGGAISSTGDRVAIWAPQPDPTAGEDWRPRVDVFLRGASGWSLEQKIMAPVGPTCGMTLSDRGLALSGNGARLLIGDSSCEAGIGAWTGRVHAYKRVGSTWSRIQTIASPESVNGELFGQSVAMSADGLTAAIGVSIHPANSGFARAAWVFEFSAGKWRKRTRLGPTVVDPDATFACTALVRAGARIVCTAHDTHGFNTAQGTLYVFNRPAAGWSAGATPTRLFAPTGYAFDRLGAGNQMWSPDPAVREDGKVIQAPISALSLAVGGYKDRIGYEFRR